MTRRPRELLVYAAALSVTAVLPGCHASHNMLYPGGPQAEHITRLWWLFFIITCVIYLIVLVFLGVGIVKALMQRRDPTADAVMATDEPMLQPPVAGERARGAFVIGCVALTVGVLVLLLLNELFTARAMSAGVEKDPINIIVTGHQWWWEIRYEGDPPSDTAVTANEIHLPIGRTARLLLQSRDVIHSFWAPSLEGKRDLVPGHPTTLYLRADKEGDYWGQCAEFCGMEHAKMRFVVVAERPEVFDQWIKRQRGGAREGTGESEKRGREVFMGTTCVMCHTIAGTPARGAVGPDLTHVATRRTIGSGAFPNNRGYLAGWIVDPQHLKPGVLMPQHVLQPQQLNDLLDYLESLK